MAEESAKQMAEEQSDKQMAEESANDSGPSCMYRTVQGIDSNSVAEQYHT